MVNAFDPITNPLGWLVVYFIFGIGEEGLIALFKLALFSSVITYPFLLVGNYLLKRADKRRAHLLNMYTITLLVSILFFIVMRIWATILGEVPLIASLVNTVLIIIIGSIVAFLFVLLGRFLMKEMRRRWQMPDPIAFYTVDLIICIIFWIIAEIVFISYISTLV